MSNLHGLDDIKVSLATLEITDKGAAELKVLEDKMAKYQKKGEELSGASLSYEELFPKDFMAEYTDFSSLRAFFKFGGFKVTDGHEIAKISIRKLDRHVKYSTKFSTWKEMSDKATEVYVVRLVDSEE